MFIILIEIEFSNQNKKIIINLKESLVISINFIVCIIAR